MNEIYEYQYSFYRQRVDCFFEYVEEAAAPNMFYLQATRPVTKQEFRDYCEALRDNEPLSQEQQELSAAIEQMGAAW